MRFKQGDRVLVSAESTFQYRKGVVQRQGLNMTAVLLDGSVAPTYWTPEELELDVAMTGQEAMEAAVRSEPWHGYDVADAALALDLAETRLDALSAERMEAVIPDGSTREDAPSAVLRETADVLEERGRDYDNEGYSTIRLTAKLWGEYLDRAVSPREVAVLMSLHKIARQRSAPDKRDTYVDAAGYIALALDQEDW